MKNWLINTAIPALVVLGSIASYWIMVQIFPGKTSGQFEAITTSVGLTVASLAFYLARMLTKPNEWRKRIIMRIFMAMALMLFMYPFPSWTMEFNDKLAQLIGRPTGILIYNTIVGVGLAGPILSIVSMAALLFTPSAFEAKQTNSPSS